MPAKDPIAQYYDEFAALLDSNLQVKGRSITLNFRDVKFKDITIKEVSISIVSGSEGYHVTVGSFVDLSCDHDMASYTVFTADYGSGNKRAQAQIYESQLFDSAGFVVDYVGSFESKKLLYSNKLTGALVCLDYYLWNIIGRLYNGFLRVSNGKLVHVNRKTEQRFLEWK